MSQNLDAHPFTPETTFQESMLKFELGSAPYQSPPLPSQDPLQGSEMRQYDKLSMEALLRSTQFLPGRKWPLPPCPITCLLILGIWICSPNTCDLFSSFVFYANQTLFISLFNNLKSAHFFTAASPTPKTHPCSAYAISQQTKFLTKGIFGTSLWAVSDSCSPSIYILPFSLLIKS